MTVQAIIVDDERLARVALRKLLDQHGGVEVIGEADSIKSASKLIDTENPDVIFLDVQLSGETGFDLFAERDVVGRVIFVTAYDEFAVRAFEVNALDYLVKPATPEQLARALSRIGPSSERRSAGEPSAPIEAPALAVDDVICLYEGSSMKFTAVRDIVFISAADDYTEVHLESGRMVMVDTPLKKWADRLPVDVFLRMHRSSLVNIKFIDEITHEEARWVVSLRGRPEKLPMSRRSAQMLKKRLELDTR